MDWHPSLGEVNGEPEVKDWLGIALSANDFDGDVAADLAIGSSGDGHWLGELLYEAILS